MKVLNVTFKLPKSYADARELNSMDHFLADYLADAGIKRCSQPKRRLCTIDGTHVVVDSKFYTNDNRLHAIRTLKPLTVYKIVMAITKL